jgi:flagellar basal body P-ring formation protein FlgA
MTTRTLLLAAALLVASAAAAFGASGDDTIAAPVLRANVTVTGDVVRIGDVIDNAGVAAQIAIYRAPDLGTTGTLPTAQVLSVLRAHQVIGVEAKDIKQVSVTRLARTVEAKEIEQDIAHALEHRGGLGDAANLTLTFDRDLQDVQLDASNSGAMQPVATRFEPRSGRFDVTFEVADDSGTAATRLRFTGNAIETVEAAVLTRNVERNDILKSSDVVIERRPKADVGGDAAGRNHSVGMQMRHPMRSGQPLRSADLVKPDLVQRDQEVTVIYQSAGLYLTTRGKALDSGAEGDLVNVLNPQTKRTLSGTVSARAQVTIQIATPKPVAAEDLTSSIDPDQTASQVAATGNPPAAAKPE